MKSKINLEISEIILTFVSRKRKGYGNEELGMVPEEELRA